MTISDLLFLVMLLVTTVVVVTVLVKLVLGRGRSAAQWAMGAVSVWAVYLVAGLAVAVATPQRVIPAGEEQCFDEMCFSIAKVARKPMAPGETSGLTALYLVSVETANHGHTHPERESGVVAFLMDAAGKRYWPVGESGAGLDAPVAAGESVETRLQFEVPAGARGLGLGLDHGGWLYPGKVILSDEAHVGHKPTLLALE